MVACEKNQSLKAFLLADDMGLGKTATTLALTLIHPVGCTLILVPSALIAHNWRDEIELNISGAPRVAIFPSVGHLRRSTININQLVELDYVVMVHSCLNCDLWKKVKLSQITCIILTLANRWHSYLGSG